MTFLNYHQFQFLLVDALVSCNPDPAANVRMVAGDQKEGVVEGLQLSAILDFYLESRLSEENPDSLIDIGESAKMVMVQEGLSPRVIGGVDDCCVETNPEVVEKDPIAIPAVIVVVADVDLMGPLVGKNLDQGLPRVGCDPISSGKIVSSPCGDVGYRQGIILLDRHQTSDRLMEGAVATDYDQTVKVVALSCLSC